MAKPRSNETSHSMSPEEFDRRAAGDNPSPPGQALVPSTPAQMTSTPAGFLSKALPTAIAEMTSGEYEIAPIFVKVEPPTGRDDVGDIIEGYLVGKSQVEIQNQNTRAPEPVDTWILENEKGDARVCFLTAYQLDRDLQDFDTKTGEVRPKFGRYVKIARLADERVGQKMVSRYLISFHKSKRREVK